MEDNDSVWDMETIERLNDRKTAALVGGGAERVAKQHAAGKLTARERLGILFDAGTFIEVGGLMEARSNSGKQSGKGIPGDGVVTAGIRFLRGCYGCRGHPRGNPRAEDLPDTGYGTECPGTDHHDQ